MSDITHMKHLSAVVPSEIADRLKEIAGDNDRSVSAEVRLALREHVDRHPREQREEATPA